MTTREIKCPECHGSGRVQIGPPLGSCDGPQYGPCSNCDGRGYITVPDESETEKANTDSSS